MTRRSLIRVLVVDDSVVARRFITGRLERDPELEVIGTANSGAEAVQKVDADPPHVLVLDEEMPEMSGRDVLRVLRKEHPEVAVIMFSARVGQGTMARFEALMLGADDAVAKPRAGDGPVTDNHPTWTELVAKVKRAARSGVRGGVHVDIARAAKDAHTADARDGSARAGAAPAAPVVRASDVAETPAAPPPVARRPRPTPAPVEQRAARPTTAVPISSRPTGTSRGPATETDRRAPARPGRNMAAAPGRTVRTTDPGAVIIASSTGGPDALGVLFRALPVDFPLPILVVQHMPADFTALLARRLDGRSALQVTEAQGGEAIARGTAHIAPGEFHLEVEGRATGSVTRLTTAPPENSCRPAADVLFRSAVAAYGDRLVSVVLSGMGQDGMLGCEQVRAAGGQVIAQDEPTSVVWGMPGAVVRAGLHDVELPIEQIADELTRRARVVAGSGRGERTKALR